MNIISELILSLSALIYSLSYCVDVLHGIYLDTQPIDEVPEAVKHMYN